MNSKVWPDVATHAYGFRTLISLGVSARTPRSPIRMARSCHQFTSAYPRLSPLWGGRRWLKVALSLGLLLAVQACRTPVPQGKIKAKAGARPQEKKGLPTADPVEFERRVRASALFATGLLKQYNNQGDEALEDFYEAGMADASHEPLILDVASRLILFKKDSVRALVLLEKAAKIPSNSGRIEEYLALAYLNQGKTQQAIQAYEAGIRKSPRLLSVYRGLASLHAHHKRFKEAMQVLDGAIQQPEERPTYWLELSEHLEAVTLTSGEPPSAVKDRMATILSKLSPEQITDPAALQRVADRYKAAQDLPRAEKVYLLLLQKFPRAGNVREKLVDIYLRQGKKELASQQLESVGREYPTNPQVQLYLGRIFHSEKNFARAQECLERGLLLDPDFFPVYYELTRLMMSQGKAKEALGFLERARKRDVFKPNFASEFYTAVVQGQLKNYAQALRHMTEAEVMARASDSGVLTREFYYQYGSIQERHGNFADAEKSMRKALEISPDFAEALNYLGYMWADRGENLAEARKFIEQAVKAEPANAAFLDSLGWVLFKLGKPKEGLDFLLKAIEKSEEPDPTLYEHVGRVHEALGDKEKAREALKKSLTLEPNPEVQKRLDRIPLSKDPAQ